MSDKPWQRKVLDSFFDAPGGGFCCGHDLVAMGYPKEKLFAANAPECLGSIEKCFELGDDECTTCAERDCPHKEPLHYHHDGCPMCDAEKPE